MKVDKYRQEHEEIFTEVKVLAKSLYDIEGNLEKIKESFAQITSKLKRHLAKEDKILYPAIMSSNDEILQASARKCQAEMENVSDLWTAFISTWGDPTEIIDNKSHFIADFKKVVSALGTRMILEEKELYPRIENHFKITSS
jgi:iron-sulfur cluster repair protein YtfE (RIC family)